MRSASRSPGLAVIHQNNPAVIVAIMAVGVLQRRAILQIDNLLHLQHRIGRFAVKMLFIQFPGLHRPHHAVRSHQLQPQRLLHIAKHGTFQMAFG